MARRSDEELKPRNGRTLVVGIVCRISGCTNQKELSLEDQEDNAKQTVADLYPGPVDYRVIATKGKGERLDRPELERVEKAYRSREFDLFVYDDLSRLVRGTRAAELLGIGVDHETRTICINDGIDTADDSWEVDAINACSESVAHNERTSKRIKQKNMNRFRKFGGSMARPIYGYQLPDGAKTYDDWQKDSAAERHILEGARILRSTLNGNAVADYFNAHDVPVGPYARNERWDGVMVLRLYRNTLLKGVALRGRNHTVKNHGTGRRVQRRNPKGPTFYPCPHLAYFTEAEFDDLVARLHTANEQYRRKKVNGVDPRANVARKRTRFPGQHARCWYCGRNFNWGGNGDKGHLMCSGSHSYSCWNSIHIDGKIVVEHVKSTITQTLFDLDGFDTQFRELVETAAQSIDGSVGQQLTQLAADEQLLERESNHVLAAIKAVGISPTLQDELVKLDRQRQSLAHRRFLLEKNRSEPVQLPQSVGELRRLVEAQFEPLNTASPEFGDLLRQIVPEFDVYLVRLVDGGHLLPRARIKLDFTGVAAETARVAGLSELLTRELHIDLFEPPQRERIRNEVVRLHGQGLYLRKISAQIDERPAMAAVQASLALHRQMQAASLNTPYVPVLEPPASYSKLRRHKNIRYRFATQVGYVRRDL
jgi:site-specific DNA recombinase